MTLRKPSNFGNLKQNLIIRSRQVYNILKVKPFLYAWLSYTLSATSTTFIPTIVTLIIIDEYEHLSSLGWVLGCRTIGFILGAMFSGVFTDHFKPKRILFTSAIARFLALVMLIIFLHDGLLILSCLMISIIGCGEGFFRSSYLALIANVVAEEDRISANAISTLSMRLSLTVSPLLATAIYSIVDGYFALWFASAFLFAPCILITKIASSKSLNKSGFTIDDFLRGYKEGFNEAIKHRWFIAGLIALALWLSMSYSIQQIMLPVVSKTTYDSNALIGIALGFYSAGAILASLVIGNLKINRIGILAFFGLAMYGLVPISLAYEDSIYLICFAYFMGGVGIEAFNIPWFTAIQREVPENLVGRVTSFDFLVSYGVAPITLAVFPYVIDLVGGIPVLYFCGAITIIACLIVLIVPGASILKDSRNS